LDIDPKSEKATYKKSQALCRHYKNLEYASSLIARVAFVSYPHISLALNYISFPNARKIVNLPKTFY